MNDLDHLESRVRADLVPFVDPGAELTLLKAGSTIKADWVQRRQQRSATFVMRAAFDVIVKFAGREFSYKSFFASSEMGDLLGIAKTSLGLHRLPGYVETTAETCDIRVQGEADAQTEGPAIEILGRLAVVDAAERERTTFVMVTGEAGAGKTWVLKELVRRQAQAYSDGKAEFVYLYVDAQGRALAKFHEALATELNELRVALPYHAVAKLVRLGLIIPVVDGFDELIGVGGYDDAFSSISSFVDDLDGAGSIVASARSTYYEQEFLARAGKGSMTSGPAWRLVSAQVKAWSEQQRSAYVSGLASRYHVAAEELSGRLTKVFSGSNEVLADKPLFFARTAELVASGEDLSEGGSLTEQLVETFITRELRQKLLDRNSQQILSRDQLWALCADMAEEMWSQSTRELDKFTIRDIAEYALSDAGMSPSSKVVVVDRMPSMAFLRRGDAEGSVAFEHEIFFDHFLARRMGSRLEEKGPMTTVMLGRSAMPDSLATEVAGEMVRVGICISDLASVLTSSSCATGLKQAQVRENCGRLLGAVIKAFGRFDGSERALVVKNLVFPGSDFSAVRIVQAHFEDCEFRRVNIAGALIDRCVFKQCVFEAPFVSEGTRFVSCELDSAASMLGVRCADVAGGVRQVFDPIALSDLLISIGAEAPKGRSEDELSWGVEPDAVKFVERVARAYSKCNPVSFEDDQFPSVASSGYWQDFRRAAIESGVLTPEVRAAHGPRREFLRRQVRMEDLLAGLSRSAPVPPHVSTFWALMAKRFPARVI